MPDGFMFQVDEMRRTFESIDSTIEDLNFSVEKLDKNSTKMSETSLEVAQKTKELTQRMYYLSWIMASCAGAGVIISIISMIIALQK